jgi:hypothetical protein
MKVLGNTSVDNYARQRLRRGCPDRRGTSSGDPVS